MIKENMKYTEQMLVDIIAANSPFNMGCWSSLLMAPQTLDESHSCGMTACVGGYLALTDKWIADGGSHSDGSGEPKFGGLRGYDALAVWLGLSTEDVCYFANPGSVHYTNLHPELVTATDALEAFRVVMAKNEAPS